MLLTTLEEIAIRDSLKNYPKEVFEGLPQVEELIESALEAKLDSGDYVSSDRTQDFDTIADQIEHALNILPVEEDRKTLSPEDLEEKIAELEEHLKDLYNAYSL